MPYRIIPLVCIRVPIGHAVLDRPLTSPIPARCPVFATSRSNERRVWRIGNSKLHTLTIAHVYQLSSGGGVL